MRKIVTISYTGLDAPGGVPRWNRDLHSAFPDRECVHYCWNDVLPAVGGRDQNIPEWDRAHVLNAYLKMSKRLTGEEVVLVDGFWGLGLEWHPRVISVAHGNWSHTTADDVARGIPPEFPFHHNVQLKYRRDHLARGGKIVAVSKFIADQCKMQWDMDFPYINNGIDLSQYSPAGGHFKRKRPLIIHGTTTANKGFDHIEALKKLDADVMLLDEAAAAHSRPKYEMLAHADLVVHPSAHEGNSYFVLETLACGVPLVTYNVGLMWELWERGFQGNFGSVIDRTERSPHRTTVVTRCALEELSAGNAYWTYNARKMASAHSIEKFRQSWQHYVESL